MDQEFLSVKIRDGLFIGNKQTASDFEFLIANRFKYVLNCTSEVKNYFQSSNFIKYYKLKYSKHKPHQLLWKDNLKKLNKIMDFINTAEEDAECCLIHSNDGNNRSIVVAIAYLMVKYKWKLFKTLQFLESKNIQSKLTENYIQQLKALEETLSSENILSSTWEKGENISEDELVMTNTYLNSIEISFKSNPVTVPNLKKVQWKDRLEKIDKIQKQKKAKTLLKQQTKTEKRVVKSQIIQVKKQTHKDTKENKEKDKNTHRPSSSVSKSYAKKTKDEQISEKPRDEEKEQQRQSGDSSTDDRPHNNRLINNFMNAGDQPKRTSKMPPRKSQQNIKMTRAFSEKEYSSFKETNKSNSHIPVNTSKQSLKAPSKKEGKTELPPKHFKSLQDGRLRATSPKPNNVRPKN